MASAIGTVVSRTDARATRCSTSRSKAWSSTSLHVETPTCHHAAFPLLVKDAKTFLIVIEQTVLRPRGLSPQPSAHDAHRKLFDLNGDTVMGRSTVLREPAARGVAGCSRGTTAAFTTLLSPTTFSRGHRSPTPRLEAGCSELRWSRPSKTVELIGIEPTTSGLQSPRSPS